MSLRRYDSYCDSSIEWLGVVPCHWAIQRLGFHFDERREKVSDTDFAPLSVTKNGIVPQLENAAKTDDGDNRKKVLAGDFVINSRSDRKGSAGLSELDGSVSLINIVLTPRPSVQGRFVHYLLRSVPFQEEFYRYGKGIVADLWSTNFAEMRNIILAVPSLPEQAAIATFLDRETAKIDALVGEQRRLINLLREKRHAVISHAVTKGLDPSATMKDSGVDGLGDVPAHWRLGRIKEVCLEIVDCKNRTPDAVDDGDHFVIRTTCVRGGAFDREGGYFTDPASFEEWTRKGKPQLGDVLFTREAPAGEACLMPTDLECCLGQRMMYLRPGPELDSRYLVAAIYGPTVRRQIGANAKGSTVGHLRVGEVGELPILIPPLDEQRMIADRLEVLLRQWDDLVVGAEHAVELLTERRAALISAAVTGKIDVRERVAAPAELAPA